MIPDANVPDATLLFNIDIVATALCFSGSLIMSYHCLKIRPPRNVSINLILCIAISDFFYSIANIISMFEHKDTVTLCHIEAFIRQSTFLLSIYFASCTAIVCYKISTDDENFNRKLFLKKAIILGFFISLIVIIAPFFFKEYLQYAYGPLFCWITYAPTNNKVIMVTVRAIYEGIPICIGLMITLVGYIKAIKRIRELPRHIIAQMDIAVYKLLWFPLILFVSFVPSMINNMIAIFVSDIPPWVRALHLGLTHSIGFTNAIVYGYQRKLYKKEYEASLVNYLDYDNEPGSGRSATEALLQARY